MSVSETKLVFVYNADSGFFEALKDGVTKVVSPATYPCRLCALTYGLATMKPRWRRFVDALGIPVEFLHKDEFREKYPTEEARFPSAYIESNGELELFIGSSEMNAMITLEELMEIVEKRLTEMNPSQVETGRLN
jgi:hypothetical protein